MSAVARLVVDELELDQDRYQISINHYSHGAPLVSIFDRDSGVLVISVFERDISKAAKHCLAVLAAPVRDTP